MSRPKRKATSQLPEPSKRARVEESLGEEQKDKHVKKSSGRTKKVKPEESVADAPKSRPTKKKPDIAVKVDSVKPKESKGSAKTKAVKKESNKKPRGKKSTEDADVKPATTTKKTAASSDLPTAEKSKSSNATGKDNNNTHVDLDETTQYWLMKAEPESRIEKGHDVKFSIDDLQQRAEPEGWDGVRNYVARNNMRAMRKGDLAFFYHSNCTIPGIAGAMRIVEEHTIDESAFDPNHPYFDPKSNRDKPRWDIVRVEFVKKFDRFLTLKELRAWGTPSQPLENMQMLKQSRLSVSAVSPAEWKFLLEQAGENLDLGQAAKVDGYESDLDGEGDDGEE